ncbi:eukaryotic translation initiation factor 3 subunit A [Galendromus occidentalis]|uniref:Eukaryotic translation initiation factor 3 subunit A n=1 Tax=Galendromus occidentalis TaxID=34638 RepID=A0AAJ6VVS9_9ACAR|nr:eukaryotic translation initiation factor 3 subunit A [Galendromus occidentalis]
MNRKSNAANLRKSIKPRESHVPGSSGVPSSTRRGFGNRTILETTRNSVGNSRMSQYGQAKQKDPRVFNEEFIQTTFKRLREFFTQRHFPTDILTSSKLTSRQFETIFSTLMRCIFSNYTAPSGNNWMELEVPIVMECLGYPQKVMKSTIQTISSKGGPIMGILDFLLDIAIGMDCDHQEAIRLLSRDETPNQFDLQIEMLAQSTFAKGVTVDSPHVQTQIRELCARNKGILDEDGIREEHQRVLAQKEESEALLQALEIQQTELESVQEECENHCKFIMEMQQRKQLKEDDLRQIRESIVAVKEKLSRLRQEISETRKIVDAQSISREDIRKIRAESKDLEEHNNVIQQKINEVNSRIELVQGSNRILQGVIESLCADIAAAIAELPTAAELPKTKEQVTETISEPQRSEELLATLEIEEDRWMKKIAEFQNRMELQLFELTEKKNELRTAVDFAMQDKAAVDEQIEFYKARLAKKDAEILSKRQALKNTDNLIKFAEKEVEDLKLRVKALQDEMDTAIMRRDEQRALAIKADAVLKFHGERLEKIIQIDRKRLEDLVEFYEKQDENLPTDQVAASILDAFNALKENA